MKRSWLLPLLLLLLFALPLAFGQAPTPSLSVLEAVKAIEKETGQIVVVGSYLRAPLIAQALHTAVTKRNVSVYILTSYYTYLDPPSYFLGLYLAGAKLFLGSPKEYYLVAGGQVLKGRGLGVPGGPIIRVEGSEAAAEAEVARKLFEKASQLTVDPSEIVLHYAREYKRNKPTR